MIHGIRETYSTSEPTAEISSLNLLPNPLDTVMVVATAIIPITTPIVVRIARILFAFNTPQTIAADSTKLYNNDRIIKPILIDYLSHQYFSLQQQLNCQEFG